MAAFARKNDVRIPIVLADSTTVASFGVDAFPSLYVLDRSGRIRFRTTGGSDGLVDVLHDQIDLLLAEPFATKKE